MKYFLLLILGVLCSLPVKGQTYKLPADTVKKEKERRIDFNVQLKNMHYWRGYAVTTAPMLGSILYYQSPNELWKMGFWGGMGFSGTYREFDYFISFQKEGFTAALWDIYNFSTPDITGNGFFDYNNRTTGRFLDLTLAYHFGEELPLQLSASTILHGRDSESVEAPLFQRSGDLRYSTYLEARYVVLKRESYQLQAFLAGAIALNGAEDTFYTTRSGINFLGLQFLKEVHIGDYTIPVQATPAWNPNAKHAYMEIAITFF